MNSCSNPGRKRFTVARTAVAVGMKKGRVSEKYLEGQNDKTSGLIKTWERKRNQGQTEWMRLFTEIGNTEGKK